MKRHTLFVLAIVIAAAALLSTAMDTRAARTRIDFTTTEYVCGLGWDKMWIDGNVMHIRGYKHVNVNDSTTPEVNGLNTTFADADINLLTGVASIRGTFSIKPNGYEVEDGWVGTWTLIGPPGAQVVRGVGRGTGVFAGQHIYLNVYDAPPDPGTLEEKCTGHGDPESIGIVEGYIIGK